MSAIDEEELFDATLVFKIAYDGLAYCGFAEQRDQMTVAGEIRHAFETFLRRPIELTCSGRTDSGVHAIAQYVSIPVTEEECTITRIRWLRAMDALLPRDIAVRDVFLAHRGFSARFDAQARTYIYRIADRPERPVLTRPHVWWYRRPLDDKAMADAAQYLVGEHDFKSFCKVASAEGKSTNRCVEWVAWSREVELGEPVLSFHIRGNAFLHSMVRTVVGTLVEVGTHRKDPQWVEEVIQACNRQAAGPTAPACGLTFESVRFEQGALKPLQNIS